ncbi:MAG TPA: hypothetical protein VFP68_13760 [Burkholderiaceae bacterium]|nr:hypothetical protein [Burkholderiaceae bacterium]
MATPNYSFEKRQRELAKKRKQEEKRQKKLNRDETTTSGAGPQPSGDEQASPTPGGPPRTE